MHESLRILQDKGILRKDVGQVPDGKHPVIETSFLLPGEFAQQHVVVNGPQEAVGIEIALITERHRLQDNQFIAVFDEPGKGQASQVCDRDAYELVLQKLVLVIEEDFFKRVDDIRILKERRPFWELLCLVEVFG
jgi:hypothetical protein